MTGLDNNIQIYLFEEIQLLFPKKNDMIEHIAQLLNVSKDAVYRRMRADTICSPQELTLLARHFRVSLDKFTFQKTDTLVFSFNPFTLTVKSFQDYLDSIKKDIVKLHHVPEVIVWYSSMEIPIFYYIFFPELISFKLYVWGRTIWNFDFLEKRPFDLNIVPFPVLRTAKEIFDLYRQLPSKELWSLNIVDNTLNQIEHHLSANRFADPNLALLLCDKVTSLVTMIEQMAEQECKISPDSVGDNGAKFTLYHNEMIYTNNTIFVKSPHKRIAFATYASPNFLRTEDERMCDYTEKWFESVFAKCNVMSGSYEKTRKWFFQRLRRRIQLVKDRIQHEIAASES